MRKTYKLPKINMVRYGNLRIYLLTKPFARLGASRKNYDPLCARMSLLEKSHTYQRANICLKEQLPVV